LATRIFANSDGKHGWHEYPNVKEVPELVLGFGQFAKFWTGTHGTVLIRLEEHGEDFAAHSDYCFDKDGHLVALKFELRTAWGWGYREEGAVTNDELTPQISRNVTLARFWPRQLNRSVLQGKYWRIT